MIPRLIVDHPFKKDQKDHITKNSKEKVKETQR